MNTAPLLGALLAGGSVVAAYGIGYRSGFRVGQTDGFENGKREGSREGAKRGFAVGYDRGKRAVSPDEDEEPDTEEVAESTPSSAWRWWAFFLIVGAIVVLASLRTVTGSGFYHRS